MDGQILFAWRSFLAALGLLTRIPINKLSRKPLTVSDQQHSPIWYPVVGLLIGVLIVLCLWLLAENLDTLVGAALILVFWVGITGALHLDGLADMADAWTAGLGDPERTISIMKDPRCGAHAVVALILCLLLKYVLILTLIESGYWTLFLVVPMLSRGWILPMLYSAPYVGGGMARDIAPESQHVSRLISFGSIQLLALMLMIFLPHGLWIWITVNLLSAALFALLRHSTLRRLGGYTGDVLGAGVELSELVLLLGAVVFLSQ